MARIGVAPRATSPPLLLIVGVVKTSAAHPERYLAIGHAPGRRIRNNLHGQDNWLGLAGLIVAQGRV